MSRPYSAMRRARRALAGGQGCESGVPMTAMVRPTVPDGLLASSAPSWAAVSMPAASPETTTAPRAASPRTHYRDAQLALGERQVAFVHEHGGMLLKGGKLGRIGGIGGGDELRAIGERLVEKTHDHFATRAFKGALFKRDEHVKGVGGDLVHGFSLTDRGAERR